MNYRNASRNTNDCRTGYTAPPTSRRSPAEDRTRLYLLSLLLTADRDKAERCFVTGLEPAAEDTAAFRDWAHSWARRTIIDNAFRLIAPHPCKGEPGADFRRPG
jgi:hypothetical protein